MSLMNLLIMRKAQAIISRDFKVERFDQTSLILTSKRSESDVFLLHFEFLSEIEAIEIIKILKEAYNSIPPGINNFGSKTNSKIENLNRDSLISAQFVRTVLNLKSSALHKLLLLVSGDGILSSSSQDLVTLLALNKKEICSSPENISPMSTLYSNLKNLYILPGVAARTVNQPHDSDNDAVIENDSVELTSRLASFLSNYSNSLTLGEHLNLSLDEGIKTKKSLESFDRLINIRRILKSDYRKLAESMTAAELISLSRILPGVASSCQFSETVLRNRAVAMSQTQRMDSQRQSQSVSTYLSASERKTLSSLTCVKSLDNLITDYRVMDSHVLPIYAALAEVLSVKGEKKAVDVARELAHLKMGTGNDLRILQATFALIVEVLDPVNDDFPFSWVAQMSEHAWVLTSHLSERL